MYKNHKNSLIILLFTTFFNCLESKGNIMAKYVPFLSPIRLLANLHKGMSLKVNSKTKHSLKIDISCA